MPLANIGLLLLAVTMIAFYATTFDALTLVVSAYSYKELEQHMVVINVSVCSGH